MNILFIGLVTVTAILIVGLIWYYYQILQEKDCVILDYSDYSDQDIIDIDYEIVQ